MGIGEAYHSKPTSLCQWWCGSRVNYALHFRHFSEGMAYCKACCSLLQRFDPKVTRRFFLLFPCKLRGLDFTPTFKYKDKTSLAHCKLQSLPSAMPEWPSKCTMAVGHAGSVLNLGSSSHLAFGPSARSWATEEENITINSHLQVLFSRIKIRVMKLFCTK